MAHWALTCPSCKKNFVHSQIEKRGIEDYFLPEKKPKFPEDGLSIECPNCHATSVYQAHELFYRAD